MGRLGELLVILAIVFMLFGTKRLKDFGGDLGAAIKGFKKNMGDDDKDNGANAPVEQKNLASQVIEGQAEHIKQPDHQSKS